MGFRVKDLLKIDILKGVKVLGGDNGLDNEIRGVTIIEAPDIGKFISGGEVLLTGLYAFKSCTTEEFKNYIYDFSKMEISALVLKKGRDVCFLDGKVSVLTEWAELHKTPILEIPFDVSFRDVMSPIMEQLFNEEVTRLKYFKATHDSFVSLSLSLTSTEDIYKNILDALEELIGNPVALFNQSYICLAATDSASPAFAISEEAEDYKLKLYSNYTYLKQIVKECNQYVVPMNIMYNVKMYLVITEKNRVIDIMDFIAIENAITALFLEFSKQYSIIELEKRYQSDIMNDILQGKIHSMQKLRQSTNLLGLPIDASYRVLAFGISGAVSERAEGFDKKREYMNILYDAIAMNFKNAKVQNNFDNIIVVERITRKQKQEDYRKEIIAVVKKVQGKISKYHKDLKVKVGIGEQVEGIVNIKKSFKEAGDTLLLADVVGEKTGDGISKVVLFSDLGILKLLCQQEDLSKLLEFVPESLQRLYNYKKPQRDDLMITLKTYLERNQNLKKTAQDLYIHYKTVTYRIERIEKITGMDFSNANEVLSVQIGLIIYKMLDNYNQDLV